MTTLSALSMVEGGDFFCQGHFERSLQMTGPFELVVQAGSGHINVSAGDTSVARVRGTITILRENLPVIDAAWRIKNIKAHPPIERHADIIKIGHTTDPDLNRKVSINYDLVVPPETCLSAATGSGSITMDGLRAPVDATAGSGAITLTEITGDARVSTGAGEIELRRIDGSVKISTGTGHIHAKGVSGNFHATTASGDIEASDIGVGTLPAHRVIEVSAGAGSIHFQNAAGIVRARTGSGLIRINGEDLAGVFTVETVSGQIILLLRSSGIFDINARTVLGKIVSDGPITIGSTSCCVEPALQPGGVRARLCLTTVSGNIEILRTTSVQF